MTEPVKGHAVRRNIAASLASELGSDAACDVWEALFARAVRTRRDPDSEIVPYWVFNDGPARIERHVPVYPFSREASALPKLRKSIAAYRLALGQPRQEELLQFLGSRFSDAELGHRRSIAD
jgi:hypothetical protein